MQLPLLALFGKHILNIFLQCETLRRYVSCSRIRVQLLADWKGSAQVWALFYLCPACIVLGFNYSTFSICFDAFGTRDDFHLRVVSVTPENYTELFRYMLSNRDLNLAVLILDLL